MIITISRNKIKQSYADEILHKNHNPYGPDETHPDGYRDYCIDGDYHNIYGPAQIREDNMKKYCLYGCDYTYDDWLIETAKLRSLEKRWRR